MLFLQGCFFKAIKFILFLTFIQSSSLYSKSAIESTGDVLQILVPAFALGYSTCTKDYEGDLQLIEAIGATLITTQILKNLVGEERPYQQENEEGSTFPSAHTSFAFSGAAYLHMRYGLAFGVPAYLASSYVGYSRVYAKKHNWIDVISGAVIGIGFNYIFTSTYANNNKVAVMLNSNTKETYLSFSLKF